MTGAAGLIGSAVIWALNERGHDRIIAVDRLDRSEKWRNLAPLRFDDYLEADRLKDQVHGGLLDTLKKDVRSVIHLGACSSTTETDGAYLIENNFNYTRMLAEWALQHGIRFAYASSAATYGALEGRLSDRMDIRTLRPLNMYGYSKQLFDLHASARGYLDRIVGLKYFNVFGPNENHKGDMRSVVHKAFGQIVETGRVRLFKSHRPEFADGEQRRDFLYVKDAVEMTLDLVAEPGANGLFNIGSGKSHTWRELVDRRFWRPRPPGRDRVHRDAGRVAREVPVRDRGVNRTPPRGRIPPADHAPRRRCARLRHALPRARQAPRRLSWRVCKAQGLYSVAQKVQPMVAEMPKSLFF